MSLFLLCNTDVKVFDSSNNVEWDSTISVIGELVNANLVSGYNDKMIKNYLRIQFNDNNIFEFINDWIFSHSITPVDQKTSKNIYLYNEVDKSVTTLFYACNPTILKDEKDCNENVAKVDYDGIDEVKYDSHSYIVSVVTTWKRDKKISQVIG